MKELVGVLMILFGILLGLYVGGYLMFVRGIIQLVQSITPVIAASGIAWGIAKIVFASFVGTIVAYVMVIPGFAMLKG